MSELSQFDHRRLLPAGSLSTGPGLKSIVLATIATLVLFAATIAAAILIGICVTASPRVITPEEATALQNALGEATPTQLHLSTEPEDGEPRSLEVSGVGTIPLLVRGDYIKPGWLIGLTRLFPILRETTSAIPALAGVIVILLVVHHFIELATHLSTEKVAGATAKRIRGAIHRQALRLNLGDLDGKGRRQSQALFTGQTDAIATNLADVVFHLVRDPFRIALALVVLLAIDWRLTVLVILPIVGAWVFVASERTRGVARQKLTESRATRALRLLSEGLAKSRLIRGYRMEADELAKFDDHLAKYATECDSVVSSWRDHQRISYAVAIAVGGVVAYLIGMKLAFDHNVTAVEASIFVGLLAIILATAFKARAVPVQWGRVKSASNQVNRYLDRIPDVSQAVGAKFLEPVAKAITFESVTLSHAGQPLLENLELRLEAGSRTAFVSLNPVEARAAAFLLPRFLEPASGRILFDGEDIAWGTLESLRAECCYVGGREPFFTGTIAENIAAGNKFTDSAILEAAKSTHIHQYVTDLPEGYETVIGEHGQSLPPGQAFLLGLARAIVRNPAVLIIEEPDCFLDNDLKALIEDAYTRCLVDRTVIFLPRRLSTVRRVNTVVLFSEGHVGAMGPQSELVKQNEIYRHWEYTTFSPFGRPMSQPSTVEQALAEFGSEGT